VLHATLSYQLVLVGSDGGEDGLREGERLVLLSVEVGDRRRMTSGERRPSDQVNSRLVLVHRVQYYLHAAASTDWLGSRVVSVLDSGAERPGFKSQSRRCRVTVLGKLFTPIVPLFTKQQNW